MKNLMINNRLNIEKIYLNVIIIINKIKKIFNLLKKNN